MDDIDYQALKEKIDDITIRNIRLEKDNRNLKNSINHYKRVIRGYKQKLEKQYYRKGLKE